MIKNIQEYIKKGIKEDLVLEAWIEDIRTSGKIAFLILRDLYDTYQAVVKKDISMINSLSIESFIKIKGDIKEAKLKSDELTIKDKEIVIKDIEIISKSEPLPIPIVEKGVSTSLDKRLDYRYLDIRKRKIGAIFKIESTLINSFREFFLEKGFIEIHPPGIIATSTEGGTELFPIRYFEKKAFLAQSPQLYKQLCAISLGNVFSTGPVWRAEKHNTTRHLNEITQLDIESAMSDDFEVMKLMEECLKYMFKKVKEKNNKELEILGIKLKELEAVYISYEEAIRSLKEAGIDIKFGEDLDPRAEKEICNIYNNKIVFIHSWPNSIKPFYIWPKDEKISAGFDVIYNGLEISSGGQRIHKPDLLVKKIKEKGLDPENFKWYINAFKYGAPPHSGWSIGLERITMAMLNLNNIRETSLFPRDRKRLTP